jgi:hypothetical protein
LPRTFDFLEEELMTVNRNRVIAIAIAGVLLLSGYVFGRITDATKSNAADENKPAANQLTTDNTTASKAAKENEQFYLSDFKTGYTTGYNAGLAGEESLAQNSDRPGYNEGFKQGYADGFKSRVGNQNVAASSVRTSPRVVRERVVYRSAPRKKNSTLNTVLTIAAPAAIGAGVGGAVGGGKGAGVGAAIGGGGGALYHLIKNRNKD